MIVFGSSPGGKARPESLAPAGKAARPAAPPRIHQVDCWRSYRSLIVAGPVPVGAGSSSSVPQRSIPRCPSRSSALDKAGRTPEMDKRSIPHAWPRGHLQPVDAHRVEHGRAGRPRSSIVLAPRGHINSPRPEHPSPRWCMAHSRAPADVDRVDCTSGGIIIRFPPENGFPAATRNPPTSVVTPSRTTPMKPRIHRRNFLQATGVVAAGFALGGAGARPLWAAEPPSGGAPHAEKLGWRLGCQAYSFNRYTFFEALDKNASLGLGVIEAYPGQTLSKEKPDVKIDEAMSPEVRAEVKKRLADAGVKMVSYGVCGLSKDEAASRKTFDFAKDMGIETIVSEPDARCLRRPRQALRRVPDQRGAAQPPASRRSYWNSNTVLEVCKGRSKRIGSCADTGHWMRSGINPLEAIKKLEGRIISLPLQGPEPVWPRGARRALGDGQGERPRPADRDSIGRSSRASSRSSTSTTGRRPCRRSPMASATSTASPPNCWRRSKARCGRRLRRRQKHPLSLWERVRVRGLPLPVDPTTLTPALSQREREQATPISQTTALSCRSLTVAARLGNHPAFMVGFLLRREGASPYWTLWKQDKVKCSRS